WSRPSRRPRLSPSPPPRTRCAERASAASARRCINGACRACWRGGNDSDELDPRLVPAPPGAHGLAHDEMLVTLWQPGQLLGEHRHALPPGARHLRDVGSPEQTRGPEGVEAWCTGRLDGDIGMLGQLMSAGMCSIAASSFRVVLPPRPPRWSMVSRRPG